MAGEWITSVDIALENNEIALGNRFSEIDGDIASENLSVNFFSVLIFREIWVNIYFSSLVFLCGIIDGFSQIVDDFSKIKGIKVSIYSFLSGGTKSEELTSFKSRFWWAMGDYENETFCHWEGELR